MVVSKERRKRVEVFGPKDCLIYYKKDGSWYRYNPNLFSEDVAEKVAESIKTVYPERSVFVLRVKDPFLFPDKTSNKKDLVARGKVVWSKA